MSHYTDLKEEAELLERYAMEGDGALRDPGIAAYAAGNPEVVDRLRVVLDHYRAPLVAGDVCIPWGSQGRASKQQAIPESRAGRYSRWPLRRWVGYAAIALMVIAIVGTYSIHSFWGASTSTGEKKTFATRPGQLATIQLPDGTRAVLGPDTRLSLSGSFGQTTRNVEVDGQVLFTVVSNSTNPFSVKTRKADIRVLGTTFSVRNYVSDNDVKVVVAEGKVGVNDAILASGDAAHVARADGKLTIVRSTDISAEIGWAQGRIVLKNTPVKEALVEIGRYYGVNIEASHDVLKDSLTGTLDMLPVERAVAVLEHLLGTKAERRGNSIIFKER